MLSKVFNAVSFACLSFVLLLSPINISFAASTSPNNPVFARINDKTIHFNEFLLIFQNAVRNKYYHGKVPEQELLEFQRKVGSDIVQQVLLQQEAKKLGIQPQMEKIKAGLAKYDEENSRKPGWKPRSEENQKLMLDRLSQKNILEQIEARVKEIERPSDDAVLEYYRNHPEKFTEPRRLRVSVILLPVPPSSATKAWQNAQKMAGQLIEKVEKGEHFADLARKYSSHPSSVNGGDLGYLHQDMLEGVAQQAVDKLKIDELTPPVRVLEGYTVFQLNGVREEKLNGFESVSKRAENLLYRDMQNETWDQFLQKLTESADIYVNEELYASADKD